MTALKGSLKGQASHRYALAAQPGQRLDIRLKTSNASNYFNVRLAGADEALCQGAMTGNACEVHSAEAAHYVVDVFLMRNAARRGERATYTLTVAQP